ncbi:MAG: restriction endonuclease subunit S [Candidatus Thiodiazotropha sp.]
MSAQLQKPGWIMVKFGEVVKNANLVEREPEANGIEKIVGLEHIDRENLHIRRWNSSEDGTSFTRKFVPGQTLFGKRRAYQRKVAYAEFEGICSGDILTFEPKDRKVLLPELLPFICQSDAFFDHALGTSAGSLSPRTSWTALKDFEFSLPPLDEQKRIAEIMWAVDEVFNQHQQSNNNLMSVKRTLLNRLTVRGIGQHATQHTRLGEIPVHWRLATVEDVTSICQYGLSIPLNESGQYPILRMMNYDDGRIISNDLKYVDLNDADFNSFKVHKDDILFNRTNSADLVGKVGIFDLEGDYVFASYLVRLRADRNQILPDFLNYYLNSDLGQRRLLAYATPGVSQTNISAGNLKKVLVPLPPMEEQKQIVEVLNNVERRKHLQRNHVAEAQKCLIALINNLLGATIAEEVSHV